MVLNSVEVLSIIGMGVVNSIASSCCSSITKKKINVNVERELKKKKYGEHPTEEQLEKAAKIAARKCIAKRYLINAAVSSATLVGTTVLATSIVNNANTADTSTTDNTSDSTTDTSADSTATDTTTDTSDVSNVA